MTIQSQGIAQNIGFFSNKTCPCAPNRCIAATKVQTDINRLRTRLLGRVQHPTPKASFISGTLHGTKGAQSGEYCKQTVSWRRNSPSHRLAAGPYLKYGNSRLAS